MADVLHTMYMDKTNYVYLTFLKSILSDLQVAVKSFEGEQTDAVKLFDNLVHFLTSICSSQLYGNNWCPEGFHWWTSPSISIPWVPFLFRWDSLKIQSSFGVKCVTTRTLPGQIHFNNCAKLHSLPSPCHTQMRSSNGCSAKWVWLRNWMSLHTLKSILLVLYGSKLACDTCYQHKLPGEVQQQFGTTAACSFKATPSSTAGSSSVTMQLDSEDEEDFLANLWFIIFTVRMQGVDFLELAGTHSWRWQCALQCQREQWQYLEETIEQLASQAAQQPEESCLVNKIAYIPCY